MENEEEKLFMVASTIIHLMLEAMAVRGVAVVLNELKEVNKLRSWNDDCSVTVTEAYKSTLAGVAIVNIAKRLAKEKGEKDEGGGV